MRKTLTCCLFLLFAAQTFIWLIPLHAEYYESVYARKEKYIPERILVKIRAYAEKRYPDNGILQQNTIEMQKKAFLKIQEYTYDGVPSVELEMIKQNAARQNPNNFVRQLVTIEKQAKSQVKQAKSQAKNVE